MAINPVISSVVEGPEEVNLNVFATGFLESEPDWRFVRNDGQVAPGRSIKSATLGRARAHESSLQGNGHMAVVEDEGN